MEGEWRKTTLDELGRIITGKTPSTREPSYFGGSIPFITPRDLDGRRLIDTTERYLTDKGAQSVAGARIPAGAILVSCIGSDMGKTAIAAKDSVTNQQINSIVVETKNSLLYVYYNLKARKDEIRGAAGGSAQPILNKKDFGRLEIILPPLHEQRAIAHILGTLDDKIELNRQMNETLEAMAQALFKSWFVDFDPVVVNAIKAGNPIPDKFAERAAHYRENPTALDLPEHILRLFPDRFVESELGPIPEEWEVRALDKIAHFQNGLALQKYRPKPGEARLPVVKIAQLRSGRADTGEWASANLRPGCIIDNGDVIFSWSGSLLLTIWCGGRAALNQHLFKVTSEEYPKWFYFHWILHHLPGFIRIASGKATTMGHIKRNHLSEAKCVVPDKPLLSEANQRFDGFLEQQIQNGIESRTLAALRDTLLPKLIAGELRVPDMEKILKEVQP